MNFDSLIGQSELKESLINVLVKDSCAHAYVFTGPDGIGKNTFSGDFAQMLLCTEPGPRACGKCIACGTYMAGTNPDFLKVEADGNSISVDSIRAIQSGAVIRPMYSKKKVYYIKQAEKMTQQAQNSLLKVLEEPPEYCVIILSTNNVEMLIPTVRSRLIKYVFRKNTNSEIIDVLNINNISISNIDFITSYANGVPGLAIKLASSEDFSKLREQVFQNLAQLMGKSVKGQFDMAKFIIQNADDSEVILSLVSCFYRDLLMAKSCKDLKVLINSDKEDMIREYSKKMSSERLCKIVEVIEDIRLNIRQNANIELAADVLTMRLREE